MNLADAKYAKYALVEEMMQTIDIIGNFRQDQTKDVAAIIKRVGKLFLTGEGSSRIFPAKNAIRKSLIWGMDLSINTDGSRQSAQYNLSKFAIICASNSGRTKEVILLAKKNMDAHNENIFALTANKGTLLEKECPKTFILNCGWEKAVSASKSVIEQALFYESILWNIRGIDKTDELTKLPELFRQALTMVIPSDIITMATKASTIYFSGYNDGVAEELTLKTNEITRKKSDFLEGTYAVHGIEEVMEKTDIVFVIDPIEEEIEKFQEVLEKTIGLKVIAIADHETPFTTIRVPFAGAFQPYIFIAAGWNLLVEIGLAQKINIDKPERARKVGNELR